MKEREKAEKVYFDNLFEKGGESAEEEKEEKRHWGLFGRLYS